MPFSLAHAAAPDIGGPLGLIAASLVIAMTGTLFHVGFFESDAEPKLRRIGWRLAVSLTMCAALLLAAIEITRTLEGPTRVGSLSALAVAASALLGPVLSRDLRALFAIVGGQLPRGWNSVRGRTIRRQYGAWGSARVPRARALGTRPRTQITLEDALQTPTGRHDPIGLTSAWHTCGHEAAELGGIRDSRDRELLGRALAELS
jgi:hypothetical protein